MIPLALTIAVVGYMEAFSVAKAIETKHKDYTVIPNRELIALGAANLIGSFFRSFPVTGGFSRSAVNDEAGANTPLASIISAVLIIVTLLFLTPLFYYLPKALLASVIMVAVYSLINIGYARKLWFESSVDFFLLFATFLITLNVGMVEGIVGGVIISILVLLYKAAYPHVARLGRMKGHHEFRNVRRFSNLEVWDHLIILRMDAPLTFINIQFFKDHIQRAITESDSQIESIILDAGPISHMDASAMEGLTGLIEDLKTKNIQFLLCDVIGPVRDALKRSGLIEKIGSKRVLLDLPEAVRFAVEHKDGRFIDFAQQANDKR